MTKASQAKSPRGGARPVKAAGHLYLQIARVLKKEIVGGVYPVGSQLPTEDDLCSRFCVSRYTVREALRRLREGNLVTSRTRAGTTVVSRSAADSYVQDVMSIDDLLAFARGAQFAIDSIKMIVIDAELTLRTGLVSGEEWLAVRGHQADGRCEVSADRGHVRPEHRSGSPGDWRGADVTATRPGARCRRGNGSAGGTTYVQAF